MGLPWAQSAPGSSSVQSVLEEELESAYSLRETHVFELGEVDDETGLVDELGQLLGLHLQHATLGADIVGFTSWSRTLHQMVRTLQPLQSDTSYVVEMVGDLGPPAMQHLAAHNTQVFADLPGVSTRTHLLPASEASVAGNRSVHGNTDRQN